MIARPVPPDGSAEALGGPQDFIARSGRSAVFSPSASVFADRNDRRATSIVDRLVAAPCIEGTISGHGADLFIGRDLVQQMGKNGAVSLVAGGELHRTNVTGGGIYGEMGFPILASALCAVLAPQPFSITEELDACAIHQQVQRARRAAV